MVKIKPRRDQPPPQKIESKENPDNSHSDTKSPALVPSKQVAPPISPVPEVHNQKTTTNKSANQRRGSSTASKATSKGFLGHPKQSDCRSETAEVEEGTHAEDAQKTVAKASPCYETPSLEPQRASKRNLFDSDDEVETEQAQSRAQPLSTCLDEEDALRENLVPQMNDRMDDDKRPDVADPKRENINQPSAQLLESGDGFVYKKLTPAKEDIPPQRASSGNHARPAQTQGSIKSVSPVTVSKDDSKKSAKRQHSQMGLESFFKGSCKRQKNSA